MTSIPPPRCEGAVLLPGGRRLGYAEFGVPEGRAVLWFHGTPGARRQIPPRARELALERGIRLVGVERPGTGHSDGHQYEAVGDFAEDIAVLCDRLGIDRFGVVGLSGGGPYVLACAAKLPDRVVAACVLGGVAPSQGDEAISGGPIDLSARFNGPLEPLVRPAGTALGWVVQRAGLVAARLFDLFLWTLPAGDQAVMSRAEMKRMFTEDLLEASRGGMGAFLYDAVLFGRHWGFHLRDITVPVYFWQGDEDTFVPFAHGEHQAGLVPGATLYPRPGEGHMGSLDDVERILDVIDEAWAARGAAHATSAG